MEQIISVLYGEELRNFCCHEIRVLLEWSNREKGKLARLIGVMDVTRNAYKFVVNLNIRARMGDPKAGRKEMGWEGFALDRSGPGYSCMVGSCEHGIESSNSINRATSWSVERLLDFQQRLCFTGLRFYERLWRYVGEASRILGFASRWRRAWTSGGITRGKNHLYRLNRLSNWSASRDEEINSYTPATHFKAR
jgi:hypothetical protein